MDLTGIEPVAFRMLSEYDAPTPQTHSLYLILLINKV